MKVVHAGTDCTEGASSVLLEALVRQSKAAAPGGGSNEAPWSSITASGRIGGVAHIASRRREDDLAY